jgi:hypothetical protein
MALKAYISVDIEGVSGVVHQDHTIRDGKDYDMARRLMTLEANAAIEGALEAGADEVVVNDSHGTKRNLLPEWSRPFAQIVVRPQRHTRRYLDQCDSFTLCGFPPEYRKDLQTLGAISGRDGDKLSRTVLTLKQSTTVTSPSYKEASLILECRKMYVQEFDPTCFFDKTIEAHYPQGDYHTVYYGEILAAFRHSSADTDE